jgi:hypothetical protein
MRTARQLKATHMVNSGLRALGTAQCAVSQSGWLLSMRRRSK